MNTPSTPRWKIWAAAAVLFITGLAAGSAVTVAVVGRIVRKNIEAAANGQGRLIERGADRIHERLVKELDLDADQSTAVRRSLDSTVTKLKAVREQTRDEVRQIARSGLLDVARQLTPAQREEFRRKVRSQLQRFGFGSASESLMAEPSSNEKGG
jgi:t-SNARE complex subunit (syntaxin)